MNTETSIQDKASEALSHFTKGERSIEGTEKWVEPILIDIRKPSAPEWVTDLCHKAHNSGETLPCDWRYRFIVECLDIISEHEDMDDARDAIEPPIYYHHMLAWFSSAAHAPEYVSEAMSDFDSAENVWTLLAIGYENMKREVFEAVLGSLDDE